ncbi:hypothetical protein T190115A13A_70108 [Tenacibaculum sp. 190524A02b]|uniref:Uncharacterized protein n=1 Tax=Tenacibaculum vairaonense TaxID=3137860 RepID=A0ABM9PRA0_9FLAO
MFVIVNSKLPKSHLESNHPLFSDLIGFNIVLTIAFLFFFILQPVLSVLQLLNLFPKRK